MESIAQMLKHQGEWAMIYQRQRRQRHTQKQRAERIRNLKEKEKLFKVIE